MTEVEDGTEEGAAEAREGGEGAGLTDGNGVMTTGRQGRLQGRRAVGLVVAESVGAAQKHRRGVVLQSWGGA